MFSENECFKSNIKYINIYRLRVFRNTAIKNGIDPDTVKKGRYYFNWTGLPHQVGPRTDRIKALTAEIAINPRVLHMRKLQSNAA